MRAMSHRGRQQRRTEGHAEPTNRSDTKTGLWVENAHRGSETHVYLYDEIGGWGITANEFVAELDEITSNRITLHLSSPGGSVFDGVAIYNALMDHPSRIDVVVDSVAASAASFIAQAGDTITMNRGAEMMIHNANGVAVGDSKTMRDMAAILDRQSDKIASIYTDRAGGSVDFWLAAMAAETWYGPAEAVEARLADRAVVSDNGDDSDDGPPGSRFQRVEGSIAATFKYASRAAAPDPPETPGAHPADTDTGDPPPDPPPEPGPPPTPPPDDPPPDEGESDTPDTPAVDQIAAMARLRAALTLNDRTQQ